MSKAYTNYIVEHCDYVAKVYSFLVEHKIVKDAFIHRIKNHDLSKWSDEEYKAYDKYFYGKEKTQEVKDNFNYAWLHHIHQNPYHWQHWVLINDDNSEAHALEMPEEYVVEMFCDHAAFSFKAGKLTEIEDWYKAHKATMILHKNTKILYEDILKRYLMAVKEVEKNGEA